MRAAFDIFKCLFIRRDQARACAAFDGHVADGHAPFHGQIADRFAAIFDHVARAASGACGADDGQGDVLGRDARFQFAGDFHLHVLGFLLDQRLRGQNMLDLGCADPVGQRAECAMGRGVAVATNHGHARQRPALFGADNMNDALTNIGHRIIVNAEILGILVQCGHLNGAVFGHVLGIFAARCCGHVVIRHGDRFFRCADLATGHAQTFKCLWAGHFMHQMAVDIQKAGAVFGFVGDMCVPDFVIECAGGHWSSPVDVSE